MVVKHTHALISYNDSKNAPQDRDAVVAEQLARSLERNNIKADIKGYRDSNLDPETYQWLILIYSPGTIHSRQVDTVVRNARDLVVERRMRGVLAVTTTPSELPADWASIRKYDASNPDAVGSILRAMRYAKVPYTKAQELARSQQQGARASGRQKIPVLWQIAAVLITIVVVASIVTSGVIIRTNSLNASATATTLSQYQAATKTAIVATQHASPTVDPSTQQARQKALGDVVKTPTTFQGFRDAEKWTVVPPTDTISCALSANNATYIVDIKTVGQYIPCMAKNAPLSNFALQVTMNINGDAGGVIFRSDDATSTYYRLSVNQSDQPVSGNDTVSMYLCRTECFQNNTYSSNLGTSLVNTAAGNPSVKVADAKPVMLTLLVRDNTVDIEINGTYVTRFTDNVSGATLAGGRIGLYAASVSNATSVTFSDLKVWNIPGQPTSQSTPTGRSTPTPVQKP